MKTAEEKSKAEKEYKTAEMIKFRCLEKHNVNHNEFYIDDNDNAHDAIDEAMKEYAKQERENAVSEFKDEILNQKMKGYGTSEITLNDIQLAMLIHNERQIGVMEFKKKLVNEIADGVNYKNDLIELIKKLK